MSGVALAACPACNQYIEQTKTIHRTKHHHHAAKRHESTVTTRPTQSTTTSTGASETPSAPVAPTGGSRVHHKTTRPHHKITRHRLKKHVKSHPVAGRRAHVLSAKPTHGAARLTVAAATGSGGGTGVWLLVILILVLVTGSTAGVLRYRRNHH